MFDTDVDAVVRLQAAAFPPPFSQDLHWNPEHLIRHIELFPEGQFVAVENGEVIGSCSNTMISEEAWQEHAGWGRTVGGPMLSHFDAYGTTLYGLDITVHPEFRQKGIGRAFYRARFDLVREWGLRRYGTGCRIPGFATSGIDNPAAYAADVVSGRQNDRVLSTLLRYNLNFLGILNNYMEDEESGDAAALLEWTP